MSALPALAPRASAALATCPGARPRSVRVRVRANSAQMGAWGNRPLPLARGPARLAVHFRREAQKHPFVAKALPTAIGFAFGDLLTQYMNRDKSRGLREQYRPHRSVLMFAAGAVIAAPVLLVFNRWMDVHLLPQAAGTPALEVGGGVAALGPGRGWNAQRGPVVTAVMMMARGPSGHFRCCVARGLGVQVVSVTARISCAG